MIWKKQFVAGTCRPIPPHADPKLLLQHWTDILHLDICAIHGVVLYPSVKLQMVHFNE